MAGLVLGGVSFSGFEIPNQVNFGGTQNVVVHDLLGGGRVLDAMGSKPTQIKWQGRFRGPNSIGRALAIDEMRISGAQVDLAWLNLYRTVVIQSFSAQTEKVNEVPYDITVEVVTDIAGGAFGGIQGMDALISGDMASAAGFTASLAAVAIMGTLGTSLASAGSLQGSTAASRTAASLAATTAVTSFQNAFASEELLLGTAQPITGASDIAAWVSAQSNAALAHSATIDAQGYVNRIAVNITSVKS